MDFLQQNWPWALLAAFSGGMFLFMTVRGGGRGLSPAQATMLINRENAQVVDVRETKEFAAGHLLNARHIPLAELEKRAGELEAVKDKPVILVCQSGSRSEAACAILAKAGFPSVHNLEGGMHAWDQAGMPISRRKK